MKILVAEDDKITRRALESSLNNWGYDVESFDNGTDAYNALNKDAHVSVAIVDWMMPGMDGTEVCKKIKENDSEHPPHIIMLTSKDNQSDIVEGLESGADDYIKKPFFSKELRARVQAAERIVALQDALKTKVSELEEALTHIRQLQGIIPICMHCNKIRNDEESWERMERYIMAHSEATFSHGVCPECIETHYPDQKDAILKGDGGGKKKN